MSKETNETNHRAARETSQTKPGQVKIRPAGWAIAATIVLVVVAVGGWVFFLVNRLASEPTQEAKPTVTATARTEARLTPALSGSSAPSKPTPTTSLPTVAYGIVTSRVLNLRDQPTTASATVSSLKTGDIVPLARRDGGWYQTTGGQWISATYLEVRQTRDEAESYAKEIKK